MHLPKEQFLYQTEQLIDEMCMTLGEELRADYLHNSTGSIE